ncbi:hypothetical protein JAAARDRAFT_312486 [Jaapia argillacea MUCL 33604]|uniref:Signal recognition particle subunit SRP72 n=1 Tax=Jaapia argillacea MUCL 33604 TaxID=933084 RepID=A0A067PNT8_9AGAM|nr:hypothetical protein JAAARDRAFT_312486 [Jaapia argillacea MUCL 33604]
MGPKTKAVPPKKPTGKSGGKNTQSQPKEPLTVSERLKRLFTSLCAQIDGGHFTNAVKTCDKILRLEPNDSDAIQTKLFLLLQTDQYDAALSLAGSQDGYAFEKAYSLYRLERESEADEIVSGIKQRDEDDRGVLHLEAQLSYRQGSYQAAFDLYSQLLDSAEPRSDEQADILTNMQASQKHLDFINTDFLHALDTLPTSVTTSLETSPPPSLPISSLALSALASSSAPTTDEDATRKAPKKARMKRVPKGVVPGVTPAPDPERWLKKSERSTFTHGKGRKKGGGATQGSAVENTIATSAATSSPAQGGKGGKKKKK